jgi:hypothetical protein
MRWNIGGLGAKQKFEKWSAASLAPPYSNYRWNGRGHDKPEI